MYELMICGLIGEKGFTDLLIGMPDEFFGLHKPTQEALWGAILAKINEGTRDIQELIIFARQWINLYSTVKSSIHRAISKI